jgi:hypothetical protein
MVLVVPSMVPSKESLKFVLEPSNQLPSSSIVDVPSNVNVSFVVSIYFTG